MLQACGCSTQPSSTMYTILILYAFAHSLAPLISLAHMLNPEENIVNNYFYRVVFFFLCEFSFSLSHTHIHTHFHFIAFNLSLNLLLSYFLPFSLNINLFLSSVLLRVSRRPLSGISHIVWKRWISVGLRLKAGTIIVSNTKNVHRLSSWEHSSSMGALLGSEHVKLFPFD